MKKALLVVSFGTSVPETRKKTIEALEQTLADAFPDRTFYRAWTSGFILRKIEKTTGERIDDVKTALSRMAEGGVTDVLIQPTHFTAAIEYDQLLADVREQAGRFGKIRIGRPLLASEEDQRKVLDALKKIFAGIGGNEALVFMGHGSAHPSSRVYGEMEELFRKEKIGNWFMGTVEAGGGVSDVEKWLGSLPKKPETVILSPFMVVAGEHALHDLSGADPGSWKSTLEQDGYQVRCILRGMGEYPEIRAIYAEHARQASVL